MPFILSDTQKLWLRGQADITIEALPDDTPIRGNALVSGDEAEDRRAEDEIIKQLEAGNEWAWCTIKVTASWKDFEGTDYLGSCSYKSKRDFIECDHYWPDMVARAFDDLVAAVEQDIEALLPLMERAS